MEMEFEAYADKIEENKSDKFRYKSKSYRKDTNPHLSS